MTEFSAGKVGRLHVLTDFHFQQRLGAWELAKMAIQGGADTVQFRQKRGPVRHRLIEAQRVADVCHEYQVPLIVDDHIDIALAVDAAGVHLGQQDIPISVARKILGNHAIIGATATTLDQARQAFEDGASYIGFGPVFPSQSKDVMSSVKGVETLEAVCASVPIPVIAISGITVDRVPEVMRVGAYGIAVLRAISCADAPQKAARELMDAIRSCRHLSSAAAS